MGGLRAVLEPIEEWKEVDADEFEERENDGFGDDLMRIVLGKGETRYFAREHVDEEED